MASAAIDVNQMKAKALEILRQLPQAKFSTDTRRETWIADAYKADGDRLVWHAGRKAGFGGSEMGALANSFFGRNNFRSSAQFICSDKLCLVPPSPTDGHSERGILMEQFARERFEHLLTGMGLRFERMDDVQRDMIEGKENPVRPWMRSSLDGLYRVEVEAGLWEVWEVDFKCPTSKMLEEYVTQCQKIESATNIKGRFGYVVPMQAKREIAGYTSSLTMQDYSHQLHHYYQDALDKGVKVDRIFLAPLDWDGGVKIVPIELEIDERIIRENLQVGDHYWWNYVQRGLVPEVDTGPVVELENIAPETLRDVEKYIALRATEKSAKKESEVLKAQIERDVQALGNTNGAPLKISGTTLKPVTKLDEAAIIECLSRFGWSTEAIDELRLPGKYDTRRLSKRWPQVAQDFNQVLDGAVRSDRVQLVDTLKGMRESLRHLPQIEPGPFDPEKVEEALLSCKQNIKFFRTETLALSETRETSTERDLIKDVVAELLNAMMQQVEARLENEMHDQGPQIGLA